jgi:transcriptional regulator with XRE-family HTH domain
VCTVTLQEEVQVSAVTAYAEEVRRVRALGVETGDIAEATGAEVGTVTSWARATRRPSTEYRARLLELVAIVDRLSRTMDQRYVPLWLNKPLPALGDERPLVALGKGRYKDVSRLVAELENDSFS